MISSQVMLSMTLILLFALCACQSRYTPQLSPSQQTPQSKANLDSASTQMSQKRFQLAHPQPLINQSALVKDQRPASPVESHTKASLASPQALIWASDRIWGQLSMPAAAVKRLHELWRDPPATTQMVLYGDSHTQGGFLGGAIADELSYLISGVGRDQPPPLNRPTDVRPPLRSPGWVTIDHPIHNRVEVSSTGYWLRQNWLYRRDHGPFGPLGIAFVTQDRDATMYLRVDEEAETPHQGMIMSVYFHHTGRELPFCFEAVAPEKPNISEKSQATDEELNPLISTRSQKVCYDPRRVTEHRVDTQNHVNAHEQISLHEEVGLASIWVPEGHTARLVLRDGAQVKPSLIRKRDQQRRKLKRRRARLKKRHRRLTQAQLNARLKAPSYAQAPHLILPDRPSLRVFGFYVRDPQARVEVNSMGVRGATIWSPTQQGDHSLNHWVSKVDPEIVALWYGTNTAARAQTHLPRYRRRYRAMIKQLKASAPSSVCLVILPPDFGRRDRNCFLTKRQRRLLSRRRKSSRFLDELSESRRDRVCEPDLLLNMRKRGRRRYPVPEVRNRQQWEDYKQSCTYTPPRLLKPLMEIQREVALEEGCAVYDTFSAMGSAGGIHTWACSEAEKWAQFDLVHLTPIGYKALGARIAQGLYSAISTAPLPPPALGPPDAEIDPVELNSVSSE